MCSPLYYEFSKRKKVSKYEKQVQAATKKSKKKAKKQLEETKALPEAEIGKPADDTADLTAKNAPKDADTAAAAAAEQESSSGRSCKVRCGRFAAKTEEYHGSETFQTVCQRKSEKVRVD